MSKMATGSKGPSLFLEETLQSYHGPGCTNALEPRLEVSAFRGGVDNITTRHRQKLLLNQAFYKVYRRGPVDSLLLYNRQRKEKKST